MLEINDINKVEILNMDDTYIQFKYEDIRGRVYFRSYEVNNLL